METNTFTKEKREVKIQDYMPCLCNRGLNQGFLNHTLVPEVYNLTNLYVYNTMVTFSLYDDAGWIADYVVDKQTFFNNTGDSFK